MAATPADPAGSDFGCVAALSTRTTTAEVRFCHLLPRSLWHFPQCAPTPTANRHFGQNGKTRTPGGRDRDMPPTPPRLASANNYSHTTSRAPFWNAMFERCQFLTFDPVFQVLLCGCSENSRLAQRHPKVFIRYIDVGHGGCDSLARFPVRNSFAECNTPLISAHGALSCMPCSLLVTY